MDPRKLKPVELCRLLNSTPLGAVVDARRISRHRNAAGMRVAAKGDAGRVDLLKYAAWLSHRRRMKHGPAGEGLSGYDAIRERALARSKALSQSGRNIGELPAVVNPRRRKRCARNFRLFCETYFPASFTLKWSDDHLKVIAKIQRCVLEGGLFAMAMPRGSGKSTLCEIACLWAILYGHRGFVVVIGPEENHAEEQLDSIKTELEHNDTLLEDFPEVCYPIRCLEGVYQRAGGQLYMGKPTMMTWSGKELILPTIPGSVASGAVIRVAGITGQLRGMKYKRPDGETRRPELVLVDDPQTDESARSPSQCATRERVLGGAVLGLGGPGVKIAGLMTVTVVCQGDLADRVLDREKHPEWQGERTKLMYGLPVAEDLWSDYADLLRRGLAAGDGIVAATAFYRKRRKAMDAGAQPAWPQRFKPDEISAVQHAMNIKLLDEHAFWAEFQNEPLGDAVDTGAMLTADEIAGKTSGIDRGLVPAGSAYLTAFIDVQGELLYWLVAAWGDDFTGYVVDYGTEPEQGVGYFSLTNAKRTLTVEHGGAKNPGLEALIYAGLTALAGRLLARDWKADDGGVMRIERCLVDANWGKSTEVVYQFCRQNEHAAVLMPSHGVGITASRVPMSEYKRKRGDRVGLNWRVPSTRGKRAARHVVYDTNWWKSFAHDRLAVAMGDPGCLALYGREARAHRMLADHLTAERPIRTEGRGRQVDEWRLRQPGLDNHWLDGLVGCCVAASMCGASLMGDTASGRRPRRKVKLSELQGRKR